MQEKSLFEYAVIRWVPRVDREEFLNVGVILFCKSFQFLEMKYRLDERRITAFPGTDNVSEIAAYLQAFETICSGDKSLSPISRFPAAERFRWLTATRSTTLQTSKVHPGFCLDPSATLQKLFTEMVL